MSETEQKYQWLLARMQVQDQNAKQRRETKRLGK